MKKKATKLLAVIAIAASPACDRAEPASTTSDPWNSPRVASAIDRERVEVSLAGISSTLQTISATPRQMPTGAPACGNVATRALPTECTPTSIVNAARGEN